MDYQVWTKNEYDEGYTKADCGDLAAAKRTIDKAYKKGQEPILTVEVPYKLEIKVSEVGSETVKSKAKPDKDTGTKGESKVRSGDLGAVPELDKGSGDPGAGDRVPNS